jgi:N-acetylglutamate synthase-like GNAT family acetyltransferase
MDGCLNAFKSNVPIFFTATEITDFELFLNRFEQLNFEETQERVYYYVVVVDGKVVGCGGFGFYNPTEDITLIWGLIHNNYHKTGLGEQLLSHRLQQITALYPGKLVTIDTTQHSYGFFEKYGFVTLKITLDFYTKGMHRYDMVLQKPNQ